MKKLLTFVVLAVLVVGCATTPVQPPAEKWQTLDAGKFSLQAPANWKHEEGEGTDSQVGQFCLPGEIALEYDLGYYSNQLSKYDGTDMVSYEMLDGHIAKMVVDRKRMRVGMYVADIQVAPVVRPGSEMDLCITSNPLKTEAEIQLTLKILRTIQFVKLK